MAQGALRSRPEESIMHPTLTRPVLILMLCAPLVLAFAACGSGTTSSAANATAAVPAAPLIATDALGRTITIPAAPPQRIISLEPSNSEILAALNVASRVIGVDVYTDYPAEMAAKPRVTDNVGTVNVEQIVSLRPDLVLDYSTFHPDADRQLTQTGIEVVAMPAPNLEQTLTEIRLVGQLVYAYRTADALASSLQQRIDTVKRKAAAAQPVTVYMEADYCCTTGRPYAFGGGSFGDGLIRAAGGTNIFAADTGNGGFPQVSDEAVIAANPQVIILTEDPRYGGDPQTVANRPGWSAIAAVQHHRVYAIDTALIARTGPRIVDGLEQLARDLHPELFS